MYLRKNSWIKHLDFIVIDLICIICAMILPFMLRYRKLVNIFANNEYRTLLVTAIILHFCITFFSNCYSDIMSRGYFNEFKTVLIHNLKLIALVFTYLFATQLSETYSRLILGAFFCVNVILMYLAHTLLKYVQSRTKRAEARKQHILIYAAPDVAETSLTKVMEGIDKSFQVTGIALTEKQSQITDILGVPVVAYGDEVYEYACRNVVDSIVLCLDPKDMGEIERITNKFMDMGITVHIKLSLLIQGAPSIHFGHLNQARVMTCTVKSVSTLDMFTKRLMDICAGVVGCLITGILFIFIAPAIKIADPKGPIFFGQERAGRNGRIFKIYKFRSMYSDAEERKKELMSQNKMDGLMFKIDADPRIIGSGPDGTKKGLGHFLRATSLDEFPNFWSILKGDMSLVGTRPPTMDEYERYELHHKSRLAAKPGLSGLWQVSGRSDFTDFEEIVKLDNEYIRNWSVGLDIKIILKTVVVVLTRKGSA